MRKYLVGIAAAIIAIALCGCPFPSLTSTQVSDANKTASQTDTNAVTSASGDFFYNGYTGTLTAATKQVLTLNFSFPVDSSSVSAIKIYTLKATADTDGAYARNADIAGTPTILGAGKDLQYSLDLSGTSVSNLLEIYIDGSALTGAGGTLKLNTDNDRTAGEALEDDVIDYVVVAGAPVTVPIPPVNYARVPQGSVSIVPVALAVGSTSFVLQFAHADFTEAALNACFGLQKFNATSKNWDDVSYTGSFSAATFQFTGTLPAAIANGETYRYIVNTPYNVQETASHNGYKHRLMYDQSIALFPPPGFTFSFGTLATETTATVSSSTAHFDWSGSNGYVDIVFTGLSTAGIDSTTVTADNIKIWDDDAGNYVPWTSSSVFKTTVDNDTVRLVLDPAYQYQDDWYSIYTFPGLKDGTLTFGDWTYIEYPYFAKFSASYLGI